MLLIKNNILVTSLCAICADLQAKVTVVIAIKYVYWYTTCSMHNFRSVATRFFKMQLATAWYIRRLMVHLYVVLSYQILTKL